ncbi:MAG: hypothetical protein U0X92_12170 [Anaerolineales bacterium]
MSEETLATSTRRAGNFDILQQSSLRAYRDMLGFNPIRPPALEELK